MTAISQVPGRWNNPSLSDHVVFSFSPVVSASFSWNYTLLGKWDIVPCCYKQEPRILDYNSLEQVLRIPDYKSLEQV